MASESLIYSFVARGTVVLAEYTPYSGNFNTIAVQCLQKLPPNNNKFTYTCDRHTFNYLVEDRFSMYSDLFTSITHGSSLFKCCIVMLAIQNPDICFTSVHHILKV
jgi:hypothetical protein